MQAKLVVIREEGEEIVLRTRTKYQVVVAQLLLFNREANKVVGFVITYKLYIRMKMRVVMVEDQVQ